MENPSAASRGDEPFIFVSYSHADEAAVVGELTRLRNAGFHIWFDEGIRAGSRWSDELATRIHDCRLFLIFITPRSVQSPHCLRELSYAQSHDREVLAVHLEETALAPGLELALGDRQAIFKHLLSERQYEEKLLDGISARFDDADRPARQPEHRHAAVRSRRSMAGAAALVAAIAGTGLFYWVDADRRSQAPVESETRESPAQKPQATGNRLAIAVLPFVNMSSYPENEYFSDGMSEEILNALVNTKTIDVIARTSSFQFKGKNLDVKDIGARLSTSHVLEGSVRKTGNRVRITAQLIDANKGVHLWSETFDRDLEDVFAMQDEIAGAVVVAIGEHLGVQNVPWSVSNLAQRGVNLSARVKANPEAYDLYLRAMHEAFNTGTVEAFDKALVLLNASTKIDAEFAGAWVAYALIYNFRHDRSPRDNAPVVLAALDKALALEPDYGNALAAKGFYEGFANLRWHEGLALARRGAELAPTDGETHTYLAMLLWSTNQIHEALVESERGWRLDPLNVWVASTHARYLEGLGRRKDAAEVLASIDDIVQMYPMAWTLVGDYALMGNVEMTRKYADVVRRQFGEESGMTRWADVMVARAADPSRNDELALELDGLRAQGTYVPRLLFSQSNFIQELEWAVQDRWFGTADTLLKFNLQGPPFDEFRRRMNLEDFEVRIPGLATEEETAD
ncbi:MAG: TIR domain-containing protein [Pseudomonadales bacterium]